MIYLGVFSAFGQSIAEALKFPIIHVESTPLLPTGSFPAPSWSIQRDLGNWHNDFERIIVEQTHYYERMLPQSPQGEFLGLQKRRSAQFGN